MHIVCQPFLTNQELEQCLYNQYGLSTSTIQRIPIGADLNAQVYKVTSVDQLAYFIKIKKAVTDKDLYIFISALKEAGIESIIYPLKTNSGEWGCKIKELTFTVYPFIDGKNGFEQRLSNEQWILLGKTLRQLHELKLSQDVLKDLKKEDYTDQWRKFMRTFNRSIKCQTDSLAFKLLKFINSHWVTIEQLIIQSEELCKKIQKQNETFVVCHSDIHAGNLIITDHSVNIVDWDEPLMAPKERDLMFIGGGVGNVWNNQYEEELFYQGYGEIIINKEILAYYRHERIIQDIVEYFQSLILEPISDSKTEQILYNHFLAMFEPKGVVDIALQTYKNF